MRNFNKIMKKNLPKVSKGFMKICNSGVKFQIVEPDSVVAKVQVPT